MSNIEARQNTVPEDVAPSEMLDQILALPEIQEHTKAVWGWLGLTAVGAAVATKYGVDIIASNNSENVLIEDIGLAFGSLLSTVSLVCAFGRSSKRNTRISQISKSPKSLALVAKEFEG